MKNKYLLLLILLLIINLIFSQKNDNLLSNDAAKLSSLLTAKKLPITKIIDTNKYNYHSFINYKKIKTKHHKKHKNNIKSFFIDRLVEKPKINRPPHNFKIVQINNELNVKQSLNPLDNTISSSNNDFIISITNNFIKYYSNIKNKYIYMQNLRAFLCENGKCDRDFSNTSYPVDPKIIFDSESNKFIMYLQKSGRNYTDPPYILIGFTKDQNPLNGWDFYKIKSVPNLLNFTERHFFDFPKIAISKNNLFISGNIYNSGKEYIESVIFQIDKNRITNTDTLKYKFWYNIKGNPFTIKPVKNAFKNKDDETYFLSTSQEKHLNNTDFDSIKLYKINGSIYNEKIKMKYYNIKTHFKNFSRADYNSGSNNKKIAIGDIRMQDAIRFNNKIFYVFTASKINFFSKINFNVLDLTNFNNKNVFLGDKINSSYYFPSLNFLSKQNEKPNIIIQYTGSSINYNPQIFVKSCDSELRCSNEFLIKESDTIIKNKHYRMGDYSEISKNHTNNSLYCASSYINESGYNQTHLYKIISLNSKDENSIENKYDFNEIKIKGFKNSEITVKLKQNNKEKVVYQGFIFNKNNTLMLDTFDLQGEYIVEVSNKQKTNFQKLKIF